MPQHLSASRALVNGEIHGPTTVVWDRGVIVDVRAAKRGDDVIDGILSPGFIDAQVNGVGADRVADPHCDWNRISQMLRSQGVTTWLPTVPTQAPEFYRSAHSEWLSGIASVERDLPDALGFHFEGPLLGQKPGAHRAEWFDVTRDVLNTLRTARMVTLAPEHPLSRDATHELSEAGVLVALGHTSASQEQYDLCVDDGARHVTHLFNAMSGVDHVEPGVATYALTDDRVTFSVVGDLIHVHPTTINLIWRAANARMTLVSDQVGEQSRTGMVPGARLAGSTTGLDAAVRNLVTKCRIPLADVLVMATERPASILRLVDRGALRIGSRADLVVLTDDLGVRTVVCAGFSTTIGGN